MKKIILTTITILFLSFVGYAQISSLEKFFDNYAEHELFTYIYDGGTKNLNSQYNFPETFRGEAQSINFIKTLTCQKLKGDALTEFVTSLKSVLKSEKFELIRSIKTDKSRNETYLKKIEKEEIVGVSLMVTGTNIFVRWTSGKLKE